MSSLWGLGKLVYRYAIHISPLWGFVSWAGGPTYGAHIKRKCKVEQCRVFIKLSGVRAGQDAPPTMGLESEMRNTYGVLEHGKVDFLCGDEFQ